MYLYSRQMQNTPGVASNPQVTINLTGVKTDLMSIAQAERRYFASENKYASFDELISTNFITVARQRPPYTYAVEITSGGFRVIATRSGAEPSGTPAQISVDENMEFQSSE
jgi:Tfp pilus assembly protein PilE